jgi:hypothetical protein
MISSSPLARDCYIAGTGVAFFGIKIVDKLGKSIKENKKINDFANFRLFESLHTPSYLRLILSKIYQILNTLYQIPISLDIFLGFL